LRQFLEAPRFATRGRWSAVSLFSGAGLSDLGYERAGFQFQVHVEVDPCRANVGRTNFPDSEWVVASVRESHDAVVKAYRQKTDRPLDLLVATPPCQGMSSSNPGRGKGSGHGSTVEEKNRLLLDVLPLVERLSPKVLVAENVRPILTLRTFYRGEQIRLVTLLKEAMPGYELFTGVVNVADYGVPQDRRRALIVAVRRDQPWVETLVELGLLPWPKPTHAERRANGLLPWITVQQWLEAMEYEPLDARSAETARGNHPLHFVPHYDGDRYLQISQIPPYSGRNAYENDTCPSCGFSPVPLGLVTCPECNGLMRNRPYVVRDGQARLIKGFHSSYRRMESNRPAPTVTTNSSHVGSDFKIHPWEHRVLSILECADLQTVPRFYDWSGGVRRGKRLWYLIRTLVGEAFPPYFTHLHGAALSALLSGDMSVLDGLAAMQPGRLEAGQRVESATRPILFR
jgi:DNA (cytosine-5)-methyltransferase 1